jgi:transglutaminase-like putative cysteine protease
LGWQIMKKARRLLIVSFVLFVFISDFSFSQESWQESVKSENGLVAEQRQEVDISIDASGNLVIMSQVYEETRHYSNNANLYSEQSLGFSETFTELSDIEAYSFVPNEKGKYKKHKVVDFVTSDSRSDGIFYDDQKKVSFVYPALKSGAYTTISYTKTYKEPRLWGYYMFSSFFPVEKSYFKVTTSDQVTLDYVLYGINDDEVVFSKETKGNKIIYTWEADHLNKIQLSKGADGVLHTAPHLIIHVDSYEYNGEKHNVLGDVADLHAWYQKFLEGIDADNNANLETMVQNIVEGKSTELEKVEAIYYWVQQNIKYIAIEDGLGGFRPRGANTVYSRRYGDCKDMSNLLHNMLNIAEIPSNLAWIGTKSIPYSHSEVPTPMADNHMICTYLDGDQYYFLDATDQYNILGMPTTHIQGREALVHKGISDFELVNVPVVASEKNQVVDSVFLSIEDQGLAGVGRIRYTGYNRIPITNNLENLDEKDKKIFLNAILNKGNNKFQLSAMETKHLAEKEQDLEISYKFSLDDYMLKAANEIYLNPHLNKELEYGIIDLVNTKSDIHYPYKNITFNVFSIDIPEQYAVSYLPENRSFDNDSFGFDINYRIEQDKVIMEQRININTIQLNTSEFDSWNKMIKGLFAAYKESIVFKVN